MDLLFSLIHTVAYVLMWVIIGRGLHDMWRARRRRREELEHEHVWRVDMASLSGLSEMQVQVALDAAMTAFTQRVHEMQTHNQGEQ